MKILFFGDIVGKIGREGVKKILPELREKYEPDFILANGENLSHGSGVTEKTLTEMTEAGISLFTSGNHIWNKKEIFKIFQQKDFSVLRPLNYPTQVPGVGYKAVNIGKKSIIVLNLLGRVFMHEIVDCPFRTMDKILEALKPDLKKDIVLVDFHAEATSEKVALAYYLDGRVTAVLGTHTHIATNDAGILPKGTAYITDVGGCYAKFSVLGVDKDIIINNFLNQIPVVHEFPTEGLCLINAVILTINDESGKIQAIKPIIEETII